MRIVVDGRMAGWTGIGRYTRHLVAELAALAPDDQLVVLSTLDDVGSWSTLPPNVGVHVVALRPYGLAEQRLLGPVVRSLHPDLAHFPHFNAPVHGAGDYVVTIHDLTMRRFRNVAGRGVRERLRYEAKHQALGLALQLVARRARAVVVPSEHVAGQVVSRLGVDPDRVVVTPYAPSELTADAQPVAALDDGRPFVLHVGNYYPHKNLELLLEALARLEAPGEPPLRLALAGPPDWFEARLRRQVRAGPLADRVVFLGRVPDAQLVWLYRRASLFVLPSLSEGFGLPGLEAMSQGLPVAAARASCLPEVYGDAAAYFDPHDAASLAGCLGALLAEPERRAALAAAGRRRAGRLSWRATAEQTLSVYRRALDAASGRPGASG